MDESDAMDMLSALAQPTRLATFRRLVTAEPEGISAGDLAHFAGVPQNTMSTHLAILTRAGLVRGQRDGRSIVYRADVAALRNVVLFLIRDCCGGRPEVCTPLVAELSPCCIPAGAKP